MRYAAAAAAAYWTILETLVCIVGSKNSKRGKALMDKCSRQVSALKWHKMKPVTKIKICEVFSEGISVYWAEDIVSQN